MRIETLLSETAPQPKPSPVHLLLNAFNTSSKGEISGHVELWNALKTAATEASSKSSAGGAQESPQFGRVFVDETIQLLASMSPDSIVMSPVLEIASPVPRRSSPFSKILERSKDKAANGNGNGNSNGNGNMTPISPISQPIVSDWAQFSTSGFGETSATTPLAATLLDTEKDVETTEPLITHKSSKKWGRSRSRQRGADSPGDTSTKEPAIISTKLASVHMTQVDEAFIDFWSDAITDPITENWPSFVICGLKPLPAAEAVNWLIVEQTYVRQQRVQPRTTSPERRGRTSPRPSFRSDISGTFAATRKRFSLFSGGSKTSLTVKKGMFGKSPKVGELGEILPEEEERAATPTVRMRKSNGLGTVTAAATVAVGAVAAETVQPPVIPSLSQGPPPQVDVTEEPAHTPVPTEQEPVEAAIEEAIPPAPINVVLAGDTPGPQVALDTSEPAAVAAASAIPTLDDFVPESEASSVEEPVPQATSTADEESVSQPEPTSDVEEELVIEAPEELLSDDVLPAIPVVDASPELPVTPVEQVAIVGETLSDDGGIVEEEAVPEEFTTAPVSEADEGENQSHEAVLEGSTEVTEAAEPEVQEQIPVEPTQHQSPAVESKPAEQTHGAAISAESPPSAHAQDDVDVPEEHPQN